MENWEKELDDNCISRHSDIRIYFVDPGSKENYVESIKDRERDYIINQFSKDAIDKLYTSALFHAIFEYLKHGANRYEIIEKLIDDKVCEKRGSTKGAYYCLTNV